MIPLATPNLRTKKQLTRTKLWKDGISYQNSRVQTESGRWRKSWRKSRIQFDQQVVFCHYLYMRGPYSNRIPKAFIVSWRSERAENCKTTIVENNTQENKYRYRRNLLRSSIFSAFSIKSNDNTAKQRANPLYVWSAKHQTLSTVAAPAILLFTECWDNCWIWCCSCHLCKTVLM